MASKQNADLVHHTNEGVEFHEDRANGSNKVVLRRPASLDSDVYIEFPTTSGTISTQTYVANATGGTFVGLSSDFTNTDATSTPENVTGMSFAVEANRVYAVEGMLLYHDDADIGSTSAQFSIPSGSSYRFYVRPCDGSSGSMTVESWSNSEELDQGYNGNAFAIFKGIIVVGGTAGTVQLQFINKAGDGTEQGFRAGTFIRIIDPQG